MGAETLNTQYISYPRERQHHRHPNKRQGSKPFLGCDQDMRSASYTNRMTFLAVRPWDLRPAHFEFPYAFMRTNTSHRVPTQIALRPGCLLKCRYRRTMPRTCTHLHGHAYGHGHVHVRMHAGPAAFDLHPIAKRPYVYSRARGPVPLTAPAQTPALPSHSHARCAHRDRTSISACIYMHAHAHAARARTSQCSDAVRMRMHIRIFPRYPPATATTLVRCTCYTCVCDNHPFRHCMHMPTTAPIQL